MPTVFLITADWTLRAAVRAELLAQGIEALGFESAADAIHAAVSGPWPDLVVADDSTVNLTQPDAASSLSRASLLVVLSGIGEPRHLPPGAVAMRRPLRVAEITARVRQILEGQPA